MAKPPGVQEILLLDDDEDDYIFIKTLLKDAFGDRVQLGWYQKDRVSTAMICSGVYRLTLVDYRLGMENGLEVIRKAKEACPDQVVHGPQLDSCGRPGARVGGWRQRLFEQKRSLGQLDPGRVRALSRFGSLTAR